MHFDETVFVLDREFQQVETAVALLLFSYWAQSTLTEGRTWAHWPEWGRLVACLLVLLLGHLPWSPAFQAAFQVYLLISAAWLAALSRTAGTGLSRET